MLPSPPSREPPSPGGSSEEVESPATPESIDGKAIGALPGEDSSGFSEEPEVVADMGVLGSRGPTGGGVGGGTTGAGDGVLAGTAARDAGVNECGTKGFAFAESSIAPIK